MYRSIDTEIWDDPWFSELSPTDKLVFLYFLTNRRSTSCGVFEITLRAVAFETGLGLVDIEQSLGRLHPKICWFADEQTIWVRNFFRRQNKNANEKMIISARNALAECSPCVRAEVLREYPELAIPVEKTAAPSIEEAIPHPYPTDTPSIPSGIETVRETVREIDIETGTERETTRAREPVAAATVQPITVFFDGCAVLGVDPSEITGAARDKQCRAIKDALKSATPDDILGCLRWLLTDDWKRERGVDFLTVRDNLPKWLLAGRPIAVAGRSRAPTRITDLSPGAQAIQTVDLSDILENGNGRTSLPGHHASTAIMPAGPRRDGAGMGATHPNVPRSLTAGES